MSVPLASFPIISTTDPDEAQAVLSRELKNLRFEAVRDRHRFRLDMNGLELGHTLIAFNRFGSETIVNAGGIDERLVLAIGVGPPTIVHLDEESVNLADKLAVCSSSSKLLIERPANSAVVFLRVGRETLEKRFQEVLGRRLKKPILFGRSVEGTNQVGVQVRRLMHFIIDETQRGDTILRNPLLRSSLVDMMLNLALTLPNNYSGELMADDRIALVPGIVRRAEEFLEAHAAEPISISDVVHVCGCSRRALFAAFRRFRGYTPIQFLTELRLTLAHRALQSPTMKDSVTSIAMSYGFSHVGRFSQIYRKRFGEAPSDTLREAIGR